MIYYITPKVLSKDHLRYGMFEVNDEGRMISIGWGNDLNSISKHTYTSAFTSAVIGMWDKSYYVDDFIAHISKDCILFTKQSHPEYFI